MESGKFQEESLVEYGFVHWPAITRSSCLRRQASTRLVSEWSFSGEPPKDMELVGESLN